MEKIKNVVFDLGGVLVGLDFDRCTAAFRSLGMDAVAELINPCYPADMIGRLEHGDITFHEACDEMRRLSGTPKVTDDEIARAYGAFLTEIPVEKLRQIDRLRRRGFRTYVLSNNNPASMEYIRRMFTADGKSMDAYFDARVPLLRTPRTETLGGDLPQDDRPRAACVPKRRSSSTTDRRTSMRPANWDSRSTCPPTARISATFSKT